MKRDDFSAFRNGHYEKIAEINRVKGKDYAGDEDALANFKQAAEQLGVSPYQVWAVYAHKHWSAIMSFVKNGGQVESEPIEGRIHDVILYGFLLLGLIEDAKEEPDSSTTVGDVAQPGGQCGAEYVPPGGIDEHAIRCTREDGHPGRHAGANGWRWGVHPVTLAEDTSV